MRVVITRHMRRAGPLWSRPGLSQRSSPCPRPGHPTWTTPWTEQLATKPNPDPAQSDMSRGVGECHSLSGNGPANTAVITDQLGGPYHDSCPIKGMMAQTPWRVSIRAHPYPTKLQSLFYCSLFDGWHFYVDLARQSVARLGQQGSIHRSLHLHVSWWSGKVSIRH